MTCRGLFIVSALLMGGCATTAIEPSPSISAAEIQSPNIVGRWKLVSIDGISVTSGKVILVFEANGAYRRQVSCNQGMGAYRVVGDILTLSAVSETEKGCDPYQNEALIDEAVRVGPWKVSAQGKDALLLTGRHKMHLQRMK